MQIIYMNSYLNYYYYLWVGDLLVINPPYIFLLCNSLVSEMKQELESELLNFALCI